VGPRYHAGVTPLNICLVGSELAPFAKTGGLADVCAALSDYLHRCGHDVRAFLPLYPRVRDVGLELLPMKAAQNAPLSIGPWDATYSLYGAELPETGQPVLFIDCPHLFDRESLYTSDPDEHLRFLFFSRAVLECCQRLAFKPDIVHVNDWQTAFIPLFLKSLYRWDSLFAATKTVLTIHNIGYQGRFSAEALNDTGLADSAELLHQDDLGDGVVNSLKTGILYADAITTVSETYAAEIQTESYGLGLEGLLRERRSSLFGIVNGVDYRSWEPASDPHIACRYSRDDLSGKEENKRALLADMGLPYEPGVPVVGIVSRLVGQKGFELCFDVLPKLLDRWRFQVVALGSGERRVVEFFEALQRRFPTRVSFYHGYSNELAHRIEAGADMFLMPSRYEPCGLNQMYSLRYGTLPIVRRTGGLADTVRMFEPAPAASDVRGNGFVFDHFSGEGLLWALELALRTYDDQDVWRQLMRNAMAEDFSWDRQGPHYVELYRRLSGVV